MDNVTAAKELISLLDLTSLHENDNETTIAKLCERAHTPYGEVAAVCVYPKFVNFAKKQLKDSTVKVATVINFPSGGSNFDLMAQELAFSLHEGADEIDAVLPYKDFMSGHNDVIKDFFATLYAQINPKKIPLKIIIESGELQHASTIARAADLCIKQGASFIKTSTGKSKISATPDAANIILETIASGRRNIGFKASGGIKTTEDAKQYLLLASSIMGGKWITKKNLRIGASSLLDELIQTIERGY